MVVATFASFRVSDLVQMSSMYARAYGTNDGLAELKSVLLAVMNKTAGLATAKSRIETAIGMIARFVVRRELSAEDESKALRYLLALFPCGAVACNKVVHFDGSERPVCCGQMRLFHSTLHRSTAPVRTVNSDWLQNLSEWFRGGITHAWIGDFSVHTDFKPFDDYETMYDMLQQEVEGYKLERCLEGLTPKVGAPWILRAHRGITGCGLDIKQDTRSTCVVCVAKPVDPGIFGRLWLPPTEGNHMPVCEHCQGIMERHALDSLGAAIELIEDLWDEQCSACKSTAWSGLSRPGGSMQGYVNHRLYPCKCTVCNLCADAVVTTNDRPFCPLCGMRLQRIVDERSLQKTGWAAAVARCEDTVELPPKQARSCGTCSAR